MLQGLTLHRFKSGFDPDLIFLFYSGDCISNPFMTMVPFSPNAPDISYSSGKFTKFPISPPSQIMFPIKKSELLYSTAILPPFVGRT